jgi:hypothetical protein
MSSIMSRLWSGKRGLRFLTNNVRSEHVSETRDNLFNDFNALHGQCARALECLQLTVYAFDNMSEVLRVGALRGDTRC